VLTRTFGCVRVVWNRTLAERHRRWHTDDTGMSYAQSDRALTAMKKDPDLAFLAAVSCVPLQQALRHQHQAFTAFFAKRARYPRFKSRRSRQSAHYTRSAFTLCAGMLRSCRSPGLPGHACGADVRHAGTPRVRSAAKQEPRPATAGIPVFSGGE
jgi:putative transposase